MATRRRVRWTRDGLTLILGLVGIAHETLIAKEPREILVIFFGGCVLGIPFLRMGDQIKDNNSHKNNKEPKTSPTLPEGPK